MEEEYKKEQEVYAKERLDFETHLTEEQRTVIKEARLAKSEDRQKRRYRKVKQFIFDSVNEFIQNKTFLEGR